MVILGDFMIEKYLYNDYVIDFKEDYTTKEESYYLIFNQDRQLYLEENSIPLDYEDFLSTFKVNFKLYIGKYKNHPCFAVNIDEGECFYSLQQVYEKDCDIYQIATRALLINDWYDQNRYCGRCGTKTKVKKGSMSLKCPECGLSFHGRIQPAVIIAIHNDNKLLMARHGYNTKVRYALIAGFVEMGESIEEAVRRETKEEVGINIKNIKYMGSQPWPFPNSLMCAYKAEYDSGEIYVDGKEVIEARWFSKDEIGEVESDISIYSLLVDDFKTG